MWLGIIQLLAVLCITTSSAAASDTIKCDNINIVDAENHFLVAFSQQKKSSIFNQTVYCLENKKLPIILQQIPQCFKPRDCLLCRVAMHTLIQSYRALLKKEPAEKLKPTMNKIAVKLCQMAKLPESYCTSLVVMYIDSILEILRKNEDLSSNDVCSLAFAGIGCIEKPSEKLVPKAVTLAKETFLSTVSVTGENARPIKILHVTDVHYDPQYVGGTESDDEINMCKKTFACCRQGSVRNSNNGSYWGSYHFCDTPKALLEDSLRHIASAHRDVEFVYLTGDLVRHHLTEVNMDTLKADVEYVFNLFMDVFKGIPILYALGNHDTNVFGMFSSKQSDSRGFDQTEVYDFFKNWVDKLWNNGKRRKNPKPIQWSPTGEGYYSVNLKERLKVIVLNSNVAYNYNWWLLVEHFYGAQLQWLQDVLAKAEKRHQKVHILSHIPPNHNSLTSGWSKQYQRIVERYRNTIVAQFNGHSHCDEFALFYDSTDQEVPIGVAWNGGALTPHAYHNPNYHIVTIEPNYSTVSALESYIFDLSETIQKPGGKPNWRLSFNMTSEYDLQDLSLKSLAEFVERMARNETLVSMYWQNKMKHGPLIKGINQKSKEDAICSILITDWSDRQKCKSVVDTIQWDRG